MGSAEADTGTAVLVMPSTLIGLLPSLASSPILGPSCPCGTIPNDTCAGATLKSPVTCPNTSTWRGIRLVVILTVSAGWRTGIGLVIVILSSPHGLPSGRLVFSTLIAGFELLISLPVKGSLRP